MNPEALEPEALLGVQQLGDGVGQPHGQQHGHHERDDGDRRRDDGQGEGPVHVDAEGGVQVTVAAGAVGERPWAAVPGALPFSPVDVLKPTDRSAGPRW